MRTLSLFLLLLPVGCKGSSDTDGSSPVDTADTDTNACVPGDTSEPEDTSEPVDTATEPEAGPNALPDFSLPDVNHTSPTASEMVSPRDYLEKVSGWYFTHST